MTLQDAVDAAGASEIDLGALPVIVAATWAFSAKERAEIEARLPFIPPGLGIQWAHSEATAMSAMAAR